MQANQIGSGLAVLLLALGCAGDGGAPTAAGARSGESQRIAAGRAEYETYCMACHGINGDGTGPVAPYMDPPPADLRKIKAKNGGVFPHAKIEAWIDGRDPIASHGTRDMPIWGAAFREETELDQLSETRVRGRIVLLVHYIESIQEP